MSGVYREHPELGGVPAYMIARLILEARLSPRDVQLAFECGLKHGGAVETGAFGHGVDPCRHGDVLTDGAGIGLFAVSDGINAYEHDNRLRIMLDALRRGRRHTETNGVGGVTNTAPFLI